MTSTTESESRETSERNFHTAKVGSYRRNGKLQSCEPCRKGKLRCDHTIPSCSRCVKRGKPEQCIYHPAPLTKSRQSIADSAATAAAFNPQRDRDGSSSCDSNRPRGQADVLDNIVPSYPRSRSPLHIPLSGPTVSSLDSSDGTSFSRRSMSSRDLNIGFLGRSSYSAVYTENEPNLGMDDHEGGERSVSPPVSFPVAKIRAGAKILSLLSDLHLYEQFLLRLSEVADGMMIFRPIYDIWIREIRNEFGSLISNHKSLEDLYELSELVWRNSLESISLNAQTTGRQWALLGTGRNLRWETVGLIFSGVGMISSCLSNWDRMFTATRERSKDRPTFLRKIRDVVESCIGFARECESCNEYLACLLYESGVLLECIRGDAYTGAWTRLGEVCDLLILLGLHQTKRVNSKTSFFICQLRIRIFEEVYGHDKAVATYLGRPPRLSHRYCVLQLPLDLTDEEMLLEGPELEAVLSKLEDGWNTSNHFRRVTWRRVWAQHARIREDILEIALGTDDMMITERTNQIMLQAQRVNESMPRFMQSDPEAILNSIQPSGRIQHSFGAPSNNWDSERMPLRILCFVCMHCGIYHTEFLLKRALVNRGQADPKELIPPARRLLSLTLQTTARRDFFRDFQIDLVCLLAFHGLPSAGVLAIELFKQEQSRQYTPEILPRSEVIQDLSVFVSALAAVSPGEGNHAVCDQGRRALKRLLDRILSPEPVVVSTVANGAGLVQQQYPRQQQQQQQQQQHVEYGGIGQAGGGGGTGQASSGDFMSGLEHPMGNDADFFEWLDNVEWDRGSWLYPL